MRLGVVFSVIFPDWSSFLLGR
eukprot:CCRYP_007661-RA/>CCRYP_007661-RA protein AED:0.49 eAED:0.49 QI:0/-1/0/1/-1/0/1/0/21